MPKYLSGRTKLTSRYTEDRRKYLNLNQAEPSLAIPLSPVGDEGSMPTGDIMQVVSVYGDPNPTNRYWIPFGGGLIPGAISVFEEGSLVGGPSSTTQLDFKGNIVTAIGHNTGVPDPGIAVTVTFTPVGNDHELMFNNDGDFGATSLFVYDNSTVGVASVGIGTATPSTNLHIVGSTRITETIYDYNNNPGNITNILTKGAYGLEWQNAGAVQSGAGGTFYEVQFHGTTGLVDGAPNFVWRNDKVGIGSTLPDRLLDVYGNTRFTGVSTFSQLNPDNLYAGITTFINNVKFDGATEGKDILWDRNNSILELQDNVILGIGTGTDMQLSHDGTVSKIDGGTAYPLQILVDEFVAKNAGSSQTYIAAFHDKGVELFYGGDKKFATVNNGVQVFGTLITPIHNAEQFTADNITINDTATVESWTSEYNVLGVTTAGITSISDLTAENLNVTGIGTLEKLVVNNIKIDGNTVESTSGNLILKVPTSATIDIDSITTIDNTQDSDWAVSSGAFRVVGGASVNKKLFVGQDLTSSGVTTLASAGGTTTTGGDLYVNGDIHSTGTVHNDQVSGKRIEATEQLKTLHFEATGVSTVGILTSTAEVAIAGSISVAGMSTFIGVSTFHNDVYFRSTTQSQYLEWSNSSSTLNFGKNAKAVFSDGDGNDANPGLEIYHNGTDSIIEDNGLGELHIKSDSNTIKLLTATADMLGATPGAGISMYYDGGKRLETTGAGVSVIGVTSTAELYVTGLSTFVGVGTFVDDLYVGGDLFLNQDIGAASGTYQNLTITNLADFKCDVQFHGSEGDPDVQLVWDKSEDYLKAEDDIKFIFGTHGDLEIYHQSSDATTYITNKQVSESTGILKIGSQNGISLGNNDYTLQFAEFGVGAGVTLFYSNVKKIETINEGVLVSGGITAIGGISIGSTPWNQGTGNGDITSDGGDDAVFGIYNKASNDHGRISLIPTGNLGVSTSLLDVQIGTGITANAHFKPAQTEEYDLGSPEQKWNHLHVKGLTIDTAISNDEGAFEFLTVGTALTTQLLHATGISTLGAGLTVTGVSTFNSEVNVFANLGIGTDNPNAQLEIKSDIPFLRLEEETASNKRLELYVGPSGIGTIAATQSSSQLSFRTTVGETLRIDENGNVGIGTNNPDNAHASAKRLVLYDNTLGHNGLTIFSGTDKTGNIYFGDGFTGTENRMGSITYVHGESGDDPLDNYMRFSTNGNEEKLRIDKSGNTTPGATDGSQDLGSINNRWGTIYGNNLNLSTGKVDSSDVSVQWLVVSGIASVTKTDDAIYSGISSGRGEPSETDLELVNLHNGTGTYNSLHFINGANTDKQGDISFNSINHSDDFKSQFTIKQRFSKDGYFERLRIDQSGNVGLGTTSPNAKLELVSASGVDLRLYEKTTNKSFSIGIDNDPNVFYIKDNETLNTPNRLVITNDGLIGVGLDNPTYRLYVEHDEDKVARFIRSDAGNALFYINSQDDNNVVLGLGKDSNPDVQYIKSVNTANNELIFGVAGAERLIIDANGHVYPKEDKLQDLGQGGNRWKIIYAEQINTETSVETESVKMEYLLVDRIADDNINSGISTFEGNVYVGVGSTTACIDVNRGKLFLRDAAGTGTIGSSEDNSVIEAATSIGVGINLGKQHVGIAENDELGSIQFHGTPADSVWAKSAGIFAKADAAWGTGNYSSYLEFYTTKTNSTVPKARLIIDNAGSVKLSKNDSDFIDTNDPITQTPLYVEVQTDITSVNSSSGIAANGLVRISDTGSGNNRFHGIELRNKNNGDVRLLNLDAGISNVSNFVIATDGGDSVGIKERMRVSHDGNVSIGYAGNASDTPSLSLSGNDTILVVGEVRTNKINLGSDGVVESQGSLSVEWLNVTGFTTTAALEVSGVSTFKDKTHIISNKNLEIGGSDGDENGKLSIFHKVDTGTDIDESVIRTTGEDKPLYIRTDKFNVNTRDVDGVTSSDQAMITCDEDGVILYENGNKVLDIKTREAEVTGKLTLTGSNTSDGKISSYGGSNKIFALYNNSTSEGAITFNLKNAQSTGTEALKIRLYNSAGEDVENNETLSWFEFKGHLKSNGTTVTKSYDIGTLTQRWRTVYAETFDGEFQGTLSDDVNANTATSAEYAEKAMKIATDQVDVTIDSAHYLTFVDSNNSTIDEDESNVSYEKLKTDDWVYIQPKSKTFTATNIAINGGKLYDYLNKEGSHNNVLTINSSGYPEWSKAQTGTNTTYDLTAGGTNGSSPGNGKGEIKLTGTDDGAAGPDVVTVTAGSNVWINGTSTSGFTINATAPPDIPNSNAYDLDFTGTSGTNGTAVWTLKQTQDGDGSTNQTVGSVTMKAGTGIKFSSVNNSNDIFTIDAETQDTGADTFLELSDTPSSYSNSKFLRSTTNKLEWVSATELVSDQVKTNRHSTTRDEWQLLTYVGARLTGKQDLRIADSGGAFYNMYYDILYGYIAQSQYLRSNAQASYGKLNQIIQMKSNGWYWVDPPWEAADYSEFAKDTRMIFAQASAPTGWTRVTGGAYNKSLLYCYSSSYTSLGGTEDATNKLNNPINGTTANRTLTANTQAVHKHNAGYPHQGRGDVSGQGWPSNRASASNRYNTFRTTDRGMSASTMVNGVQNSTGGNGHNHGLNMDIKYVGVIVAEKD